MPAARKEKTLPTKQPPPVARGGVIQSEGGMPPRVWFSCNTKLNLGNYESAGVDIGMSDDVQAGEKPQDAMDRLTAFCIGELQIKIQEIRGSTAPQDGYSKPRR